ncbi:hypothetical protein SAY87_016861 [Trapa incisa]|uniref:Uncharacterized protein n=1 Tax=Trapa incisa TaxID=236973 RepID=A0AAN7QYE8_9MYRT|nr:hypothetical protein SAY87_016861 [Trapa incisa]
MEWIFAVEGMEEEAAVMIWRSEMKESTKEASDSKQLGEPSSGRLRDRRSVLQLHCIVEERREALNSVPRMLRKLSPKRSVLVEEDSRHIGSFFLGRFMEALHYYPATSDSLDNTLPRHDTRREDGAVLLCIGDQ